MCRIFAEIPPHAYEYETRSVRLGGHATSVRQETTFWHVLEEIASDQNLTLGRFLSTLHDEVLAFRGDVGNFASLLRCACLAHAGEVRKAPVADTLADRAERRSATLFAPLGSAHSAQ